MDEDGGIAKHSGNKAGAKYGTGYCDTQCPHDIKFIDGEVSEAINEAITHCIREIPMLTDIRPTAKAGTPVTTMPTQELASTVLAATRWT